MTHLSGDQAGKINGAIWMIGLGILFYTGYWWPGIMFLIGASSITQGLIDGQGWYAFQGATWTIGIGIWAIFNFNIAVLFIMIGVSMLFGALFRPPIFRKPHVDNYLE